MIYVAAPYSHTDPEVVKQRMVMFARVMAKIIEDGKHPVSPLMNHFLADKVEINFPLSWAFWEEYSYQLLTRCDIVYVITMPGWQESAGVQGEIALAVSMGTPVEYIDPA